MDNKFGASRAIDGKLWSFSHTTWRNAWLEIDLQGLYPIDSVEIANRWCRDYTDPKNCLCKLSNVNLLLFDEKGDVVAAKSLGNTCNAPTVSIEFNDVCPPPVSDHNFLCDSSMFMYSVLLTNILLFYQDPHELHGRKSEAAQQYWATNSSL